MWSRLTHRDLRQSPRWTYVSFYLNDAAAPSSDLPSVKLYGTYSEPRRSYKHVILVLLALGPIGDDEDFTLVLRYSNDLSIVEGLHFSDLSD